MLFDLRGRGRRRTVQAIYLTLALLLGVGLVGLGIGSNTSGGGILDALKGGGGADSPDKELDKDLKAQAEKAKAQPNSPAVFAELTRLRFRRANLDGFTTQKAKPRLELAAASWERYLELKPEKIEPGLASTMVRVYSQGLNEPIKAVRAMEVFTAATTPPNANLYAQLAQLAYQAGEERTGDLAADRAVDLAKADEKKPLRDALKAAKEAGTSVQQSQPAEPSG